MHWTLSILMGAILSLVNTYAGFGILFSAHSGSVNRTAGGINECLLCDPVSLPRVLQRLLWLHEADSWVQQLNHAGCFSSCNEKPRVRPAPSFCSPILSMYLSSFWLQMMLQPYPRREEGQSRKAKGLYRLSLALLLGKQFPGCCLYTSAQRCLPPLPEGKWHEGRHPEPVVTLCAQCRSQGPAHYRHSVHASNG